MDADIKDKRYILFERPPTVLIESGQYASYQIKLKHILQMLWCRLLYKGRVFLIYDKHHVEIRKEYKTIDP